MTAFGMDELEPRIFQSTRAQGRILTVALVPFGLFMGYIGFCMGTCALPDAEPGFLLFAALIIVGGLLAWNWRPHRPRVVVAKDGITFESQGMIPVPKRMLSWEQIAAFGWVPSGPYGASGFFQIEENPQDGRTTGKLHQVPLKGLGARPDAILTALQPFLEREGLRVEGTLKQLVLNTSRVEVLSK